MDWKKMYQKTLAEKKALKEELKEVKDDRDWNVAEVCRYSNAIDNEYYHEHEYVLKEEEIRELKEDMEELQKENDKLNKHKSIKWSRDYACPLIEKLKKEIKEDNECERLIMEIWAESGERDEALPIHYRQKKKNGEWGQDEDDLLVDCFGSCEECNKHLYNGSDDMGCYCNNGSTDYCYECFGEHICCEGNKGCQSDEED
jgi:hypothetical protein